MVKNKVFIGLLIIMIFFACQTTGTDTKLWRNEPLYNFNGESLPFTLVSDDKKEEYIRLLYEQSFFIIGEDEYIKISEKLPTKKYIIVLRALYTNRGGRYKVIQNDVADILVSYAVLGAGRKVHKAVLLVEVDRLPNNVYVSYSAAR